MSFAKEQVERFYEILWNHRDIEEISKILHEDFRFRGSLGAEAQGHEGFIAYLDAIHKALGDYRCDVIEMIGEPFKVFARMRFSGIHRGTLLGYPPTFQHVTWEGAALFHFEGRRISSAWVLGDLDSLERQLNGQETS